jgi:hypothetical protein
MRPHVCPLLQVLQAAGGPEEVLAAAEDALADL